jgi:hypothetical protein
MGCLFVGSVFLGLGVDRLGLDHLTRNEWQNQNSVIIITFIRSLHIIHYLVAFITIKGIHKLYFQHIYLINMILALKDTINTTQTTIGMHIHHPLLSMLDIKDILIIENRNLYNKRHVQY